MQASFKFVLGRGLLALALAAAASAQQTPSTRRVTNIGALSAYPAFYHLRPIVIVGKVVTGNDGQVRVTDDSVSMRLVSKGAAPDGLDEIRGEFWDLGRLRPDDPRVTPYDVKRTFNVDPDSWPRPGEVTAIIASSVTSAQSPPSPSIRTIVLNPARYIDQKVTITGQFAGRNLFGDVPDSPGRGKYDFVLRSTDAAIWITGAQPKGKGFNLSVDARLDTGRWLDVTGTVRTGRGLQWLEVGNDGIQLGKAFSESPDESDVIRVPAAPPPEVVFSAPTQDETDVSMSTKVRIQFSRDIDPTTLKGHIKVSYLEAQSVEKGEPTTPTADFVTQYFAANRVLELRFSKPLERFRTIRVELSDGILGTDKQPLKPWTLSFDLGGA